MSMIALLAVFSVIGMFNGVLVGYTLSRTKERELLRQMEKEVYCHGYEDGFYFGMGEYDPELFKREIAEKAYFEYKGIKYGPTRH